MTKFFVNLEPPQLLGSATFESTGQGIRQLAEFNDTSEWHAPDNIQQLWTVNGTQAVPEWFSYPSL